MVSAAALTVALTCPALAAIPVSNPPDPLFAGLVIPGTAAQGGMWSALQGWPLVGLHSTLLPSGSVLTYGTPLGNGVQDGRTFDIWDPARGLDDPAAHYTLPNAQSVDSFCGSATLMTTGAMLLSGGSSNASGLSTKASTTFDPVQRTATAVAAQTAYPRWYSSMITLPDGRALIGGGAVAYNTNAFSDPATNSTNGSVSMTPEVYAPASGWTALTGATSRDAFGPDNNRWWYPRMWVAPSGKVFGISAEKYWSLDPAKTGAITTLGTFKTGFSTTATPNTGATSTAVMYDVGRILQVGGNGPNNGYPTNSSAAATTFDINYATVAITEQPAMHYARQWPNSTVLPNGKVVVTGGSTYADNAGANAVYPAEIWDPTTGQWTVGASAGVYRGYHSAAILLPDATVLSTGGGVPGPVTNLNAEIYYPPYLFTAQNGASTLAARPTLASLSSNSLGYGAALNIAMQSTDSIAKVAVIGLSVTTHSFNAGQRFIPARFTQSGQSVSVLMPANANVAPPGYYMVFLVNQAGVPSRGAIVSLGAAQPSTPAPAPGQLFAAVGVNTTQVARGGDGTTVVVNSQNGGLWEYAGDNTYVSLAAPVAMADVAVVSRTSIYAIGSTDRQVYRFDGANWAVVGKRALTIGAASDGTVVVVSSDNTIWRKNADNAVEAWTNVPGTAVRVAPQNASTFWSIGTDANVYRGGPNGGWAMIGFNVKALAVAPDGHALIVNKDSNVLWARAGDGQNWVAVANGANTFATGTAVAVANGGAMVLVGTDGTVSRE